MDKINLNPLEILEARRMEFLPPHFTILKLPHLGWRDDVIIDDWVEKNLKNRYFSGSKVFLENNSLIKHRIIAFEDAHDSSMFLLKCPYIGQK